VRVLGFPCKAEQMSRKKMEIEGDPGLVKRAFWLPQDVSDALAGHAKAQNRSETQQLRTILEMLYGIRQPDTIVDISRIEVLRDRTRVDELPKLKAG
jgi:hypothetical protein